MIVIIKSLILGCYCLNLGSSTVKMYKENIYSTVCVLWTLAGKGGRLLRIKQKASPAGTTSLQNLSSYTKTHNHKNAAYTFPL